MISIWSELNSDISTGHFPQGDIVQLSADEYRACIENDISAAAFDSGFLQDLNNMLKVDASTNEGQLLSPYSSCMYREYASRVLCSEYVFWINTGFWWDSLSADGSILEEASSLSPFVSEMDAALCCYAATFANVSAIGMCEADKKAYPYVKVLYDLQMKESYTGLTIDCSKISDEGFSFLDILSAEWTENNPYLKVLDQNEKDSYIKLMRLRCSISNRIQEGLMREKLEAEKSEEAWEDFIRLVNIAAEKERNTILALLEIEDPEEKKKKIEKYICWFNSIDQKEIHVNGRTINSNTLKEKIIERYNVSKRFCSVFYNNQVFYVDESLISLLYHHQTSFNYLLLSFHMFRLTRSAKDALHFMMSAYESLSLIYGKRESADKRLRAMSIEELSEAYLLLLEETARDKEAFSEVSYEDIRNDSTTFSDMSEAKDYFTQMGEATFEKLNLLAKQLVESGISDMDEILNSLPTVTEKIIDFRTDFRESSIGRIAECYFDGIEPEEKTLTDFYRRNILERRIAKSINVIYLFCDTLRIILADKRNTYTIQDKNHLTEIRNRMLSCEEQIVYSVYGPQKAGLLYEYRERNGINSTTLSEAESGYVKGSLEYMIHLLGSEQMDILDGIIDELQSNTIEEVQNARKELKKSLMQYPQIEGTSDLNQKIEDISRLISEKIVTICERDNGNELTVYRDKMRDFLGIKGHYFPEATLNTLATAELLYDKYTIPTFAQEGFDYSSVSSLYYQAFESMYNELIWKKYSNHLNQLTIAGEPFGQWMSKALRFKRDNPYINVGASYTYLIERKSKYFVTVKDYCMYTQFAYMLEDCINSQDNRLNELAAFIARLIGLESADEMRSQRNIMSKLETFVEAIKDSKDDRNNASHGGKVVSFEQCTQDKAAVLKQIRKDREEKLGLIVQLVELLSMSD